MSSVAEDLTRIGLGTATLGNLYRVMSDQDAYAAVETAWQLGVRYFDTAPHYGLGLAERRLGAALRDRPRAEFLMSTKVGRLLVPTPDNINQLDDDGFAVPAAFRREWDFSRDGVLRSLESSLERLDLDRVDIAFLHDPDRHWVQASTTGVGALVELRDQGVVGAIGVGMNQSAMAAEFVRRCDIDLVMLAGRYTLLDQSAEGDLLSIAQQRGVGIIAAGVYNSGLLGTDTVRADAHFDYRVASQEVVARARAIAEVCHRHGVSLPDAAVQFPLRHPAVLSVVLGARDGTQIREGIERSEAPIPEAMWDQLETDGLIRAS